MKDSFVMYLWSSGPLVQKYPFHSLESSDFYDFKIIRPMFSVLSVSFTTKLYWNVLIFFTSYEWKLLLYTVISFIKISRVCLYENAFSCVSNLIYFRILSIREGSLSSRWRSGTSCKSLYLSRITLFTLMISYIKIIIFHLL